MARARLCALCLLLAAGGASKGAEGEKCQLWTCRAASPARAFGCPERRDGADAKFCCGTCSLHSRCASEEARLDQQRCPRALHLKASTAGGLQAVQPLPDERLPVGGTVALGASCYYKGRCRRTRRRRRRTRYRRRTRHQRRKTRHRGRRTPWYTNQISEHLEETQMENLRH
ncbi:uncharacterized protein LOC133371273 isoform X2 [Rhineura floridana]|uniref:uncharacterized protein LOC133371273 isoform X2 n=1 Tax=Rhineura floridana TaxID=261503 RepID=UPI002AC81A8E|nr:uncharacterized protein LOC133371273 isoform X2 [Rhineura floridana]